MSGVRLSRHYVQRWCAPTRASLMTGRYAYNTGINAYGKQVNGTKISEERSGVPVAYAMMPKVLKAQGYKTHQVGKWHIGAFLASGLPPFPLACDTLAHMHHTQIWYERAPSHTTTNRFAHRLHRHIRLL